jgi:hypothetical protein
MAGEPSDGEARPPIRTLASDGSVAHDDRRADAAAVDKEHRPLRPVDDIAELTVIIAPLS